MAAAGSVPGVPAQQVFQTGHGLQVRSSGGQRGGAKRSGDRLLRQHKGEYILHVSAEDLLPLLAAWPTPSTVLLCSNRRAKRPRVSGSYCPL